MVNHFPLRERGRSLVAWGIILIATSGASAQQSTPPEKPGTQPQSISADQALYLVRSALLTLNDANRSGNYTVLRDLAAPDFQAKNTAADLSQIFTDLRRRDFDLFGAALLPAQFTAPPSLDASGRVHMAGFFATRPLRISFDMTFQVVKGQWRLFALSVATPEAPKTQSQVDRREPARSAKLLYGFRVLSATTGWRW